MLSTEPNDLNIFLWSATGIESVRVAWFCVFSLFSFLDSLRVWSFVTRFR
jgi:hypothetical protein